MTTIAAVPQRQSQRKPSRKSKRKGRSIKTRTGLRPRAKVIAEATKLREEGKTLLQITEAVGVGKTTVSSWFPRVHKEKEDAIDGSVLVAWIDAHGEVDSRRGWLINGSPQSSSMARAHHRWRYEGANPRLDTVERAMIAFGVLPHQFFAWCEEQDLCPWARGEAPSWWDDCSNSRAIEDLKANDPKWVREGGKEARHGKVISLSSKRRTPSTEREPIAA